MSIYAERLLKLRDLVLALPPEAYDHRAFTNECGTVCCALGWAAKNAGPGEMFPELGLRLVKNNWGEVRLRMADGSRIDEEPAADEFFGDGAFMAIFDAFAYDPARIVTKEMVAERIEQFARGEYK